MEETNAEKPKSTGTKYRPIRSTSFELVKKENQKFKMLCARNDKLRSPLINEILRRFWVINENHPGVIKIINDGRSPEEEKRVLVGFELSLENWGKLNQYVSEETIKGNKILKANVLAFVMMKYNQNIGFFGHDL